MRPVGVRRAAFAWAALVLASSPRFAQGQVRIEASRPAMGTEFRIVACVPDSVIGMKAVEAAFARVASLERVLSDYEPQSEVSRLARTPAPPDSAVHVSPDLARALQIAGVWWRRTDGAFDASLGALTRLWRRAFRRAQLPSTAAIAQARRRSGWANVHFDSTNLTVRFEPEGIRLDFGGIGKGFAADEALGVLRAMGVTRALVDAGGDLVAGDAPPDRAGWIVAMPAGPARFLRNGAAASSGSTYRFVEIAGRRYGHILDPVTGIGVTGHRIVAVFARRGADADALATAISVLSPQRAIDLAREQAQGALFTEEGGTSTVVGSNTVVGADTVVGTSTVVGTLPPPVPTGLSPATCAPPVSN